MSETALDKIHNTETKAKFIIIFLMGILERDSFEDMRVVEAIGLAAEVANEIRDIRILLSQ